jgi:hypothetical protein
MTRYIDDFIQNKEGMIITNEESITKMREEIRVLRRQLKYARHIQRNIHLMTELTDNQLWIYNRPKQKSGYFVILPEDPILETRLRDIRAYGRNSEFVIEIEKRVPKYIRKNLEIPWFTAVLTSDYIMRIQDKARKRILSQSEYEHLLYSPIQDLVLEGLEKTIPDEQSIYYPIWKRLFRKK